MTTIAADIGGTNSRFVVVDVLPDGVKILHSETYASADSPSLESLLLKFVTSAQQVGLNPRQACLAVAGPVAGDGAHQWARITNLPWSIDNLTLARASGLERVFLLNDFEAVGYGLGLLTVDDICMLRGEWNKARGHRVVIGAGTGLGVCQVLDHGGMWKVIPTEAGHMDFAPRSEVQVELWRKLTARDGHLSNDKVVSGPGIGEIFRLLVDVENKAIRSADVRTILAASDVAAAVTAARGHLSLARRAVDEFLEIYAQVAGNYALMNLATGGVYLAGGIAPRLLQELQDGRFLTTMAAKGRMAYLFEAMPVGVITNTQVGLFGAAYIAMSGFP